MRAIYNVYDKTEVIFTGNLEEIAERINGSINTIRNACYKFKKIYGEYEVRKHGTNKSF